MNFRDWVLRQKELKLLNMREIAEILHMDKKHMYNVMKRSEGISLDTAHRIVTFTQGEVTYDDLIRDNPNNSHRL